MKYIRKLNESQYEYSSKHSKLTDILLSNNINIKRYGASCYPDRNYCIIDTYGEILDEILLEKIEEQYIEYLKIKFLTNLIEVPNTNGTFYTRKQYLYEAHGHTEPVIRVEHFIPICLPNFRGGTPNTYRNIGYINIKTIPIKRHLNIILPIGWYKYECIGHERSVLDSAQEMISDIVGFPVYIHYHYAKDKNK